MSMSAHPIAPAVLTDAALPVELVDDTPVQHPKHAKPLVEALFRAGIARSRMKPEVDLCPRAFLGIELYRYGAIIDPACYKPPERRRIFVENDPRDMERAHEGLILPAQLA